MVVIIINNIDDLWKIIHLHIYMASLVFILFYIFMTFTKFKFIVLRLIHDMIILFFKLMNWRAKQIKNILIHCQINKLKEEYDGVIICISSCCNSICFYGLVTTIQSLHTTILMNNLI